MDREISSLQNPLVKEIIALQKKRERKKEDRFLIEGSLELRAAFENDWPFEALLYSSEFLSQRALLEKLSQKIKPIRCTQKVFRALSYRDNPEGLIAIASSRFHDIGNLSPSGFYLILEGLEKPGNLGAILRSAAGAGAAGVIVVDECVDIFHPNVVHASRGALFSLPLVVTTPTACMEWIKKNEILLIAATPEAHSSYSEFLGRMPCAFVLGSEHLGLSPFWKNRADKLLRIPMSGQIDSLNVSVTAALLLFEAKRWIK